MNTNGKHHLVKNNATLLISQFSTYSKSKNMKKAKIILTSIILSAIVGGTLAFSILRNLRPAYTYTGGTTWISTTVGIQVYSTTAPHCIPLSIGLWTGYISNVGMPYPNVYSMSWISTRFTTTTTPGGLTVSTTLPALICNTWFPITTFITSLQ